MPTPRRPGLFDPCPCGSGGRYHSCCRALGDAAWDADQLVALAMREHAARQARAAEELYRKALRLDPRHCDGLRNLAILLTEQGRPADAEQHLRLCLQAQPQDAHAQFALGVALLQQKRLEEAAETFRAALARDPASLAALVNLGSTLAGLGRRDEAAEVLERAVALEPRSAEALMNLALLKSDAGEHGAALELATRAAAANRGNPEVAHMTGVLALGTGDFQKACDSFMAAVEARPDHLDALVNLGSCLGDLGRPGEAVKYIERALAFAPRDARLWGNLGLARMESGQLEPARKAVEKAAQLAPDAPPVLGHQAWLAGASGNLDEAEAKFRAALEREPSTVSYWIGLGTVLYERGGPAQAAELYERFLEDHPANETIHFELATLLLQQGRFAEGWPHYGYRPQARFRRVRGEQLPALDALRGRRVAVRFEQGLGDQLFFLRFVPAFRALAQPAELAFLSKPELYSMAQRLPGLDEVLLSGPRDEPGLLLADLPGYLSAQGEAQVPGGLSIPALAEARAKAAQLLSQAGPGPYLALTWEAGQRPSDIRHHRLARSILHKRIAPRRLGEAAAAWPGTVLSLQRLPRDEDYAALQAGLGRSAVDLSALNDDLETMLALLERVDDYAGVSNTNMHLRAAAGRHARVLVPRPYEWRWMHSGNASPWFPGFKVYREQREAGWTALAELARDLGGGAAPA